MGGVVDNDTARCSGFRRKLFRYAATGGEQADLHLAEVELGKIRHAHRFAAKRHGFARRARAGQRIQRTHRKITLFKYRHHGLADRAGSTDDGNVILLAHKKPRISV